MAGCPHADKICSVCNNYGHDDQSRCVEALVERSLASVRRIGCPASGTTTFHCLLVLLVSLQISAASAASHAEVAAITRALRNARQMCRHGVSVASVAVTRMDSRCVEEGRA